MVEDPEIRRAAAKTLEGFCLTYLPHHFPADLSDFFDEMAGALQDHDSKRLESPVSPAARCPGSGAW